MTEQTKNNSAKRSGTSPTRRGAKKELGRDYPNVKLDAAEGAANTPLGIWYEQNPDDVFEKQMRRNVRGASRGLGELTASGRKIA
jgi:hypothetical protein